MNDIPKDRRPPRFPAPEFPPRRKALFSRTPPAIFPAVLGLLGLGLALRKAGEVLGFSGGHLGGLVEAALGAVLMLWLLAVVALAGKVLRRLGTLREDMAVLPGRAGLAAASMSGMAAAAVVAPYAPRLALGLALAALLAHLALAVLLVTVLSRLPAEAQKISPALHLGFVGFIVGAVPLAQLDYLAAARGLLYLTMPVAALIWALSLWQLVRMVPPAPLRPLLAIHLAPAALLSLVAGMTGQPALAIGFAFMGGAILLALVVSGRWLTASGFSPLWSSFTFPLAAYATALLALDGGGSAVGLLVLAAALAVVPVIAWKVLKLWPGDRLASKTNAAEA